MGQGNKLTRSWPIFPWPESWFCCLVWPYFFPFGPFGMMILFCIFIVDIWLYLLKPNSFFSGFRLSRVTGGLKALASKYPIRSVSHWARYQWFGKKFNFGIAIWSQFLGPADITVKITVLDPSKIVFLQRSRYSLSSYFWCPVPPANLQYPVLVPL